MSPSTWGPPTWIFLHTSAAKIKEDSFPIIGHLFIQAIMQICFNLPCPECAQHAKQFWSRVRINNIKTKNDLRNLLFVFHNMVNTRRKIPHFKYDDLVVYDKKNIIETYNNFSKNFNTKGNMKLLNESFHRTRMLSSLRIWIMKNISHFNLL